MSTNKRRKPVTNLGALEVWHRLGRDDFVRTSELGLERRRGSSRKWWGVCQEYEIQERPLVVDDHYGAHHLLVPKYSPRQENKWRMYYPLEDTPDLFLKFARLYDKEGISVDAILDWVHKYGLLGFSGDRYRHRGGSEETLANYRGAIHWAAGILAMYEAAWNGDEQAARDAVLKEFLWVGASSSEFEKFSEEEYAALRARNLKEIWDGNYLEYALDTAVFLVAMTVQEECFPTLRLPEGASDPSEVSAGWSFKSLYGCLHLQMYWLLKAGGNVTRCGWCGRIISLSAPQPGARKTREDKKFCASACRQRHHYHTKTKPRRQGKQR